MIDLLIFRAPTRSAGKRYAFQNSFQLQDPVIEVMPHNNRVAVEVDEPVNLTISGRIGDRSGCMNRKA